MADSQFFLRFNVDLSQAEASLQKFVAKAEKAKATTGKAPTNQFSAPQIPYIPALPATRSSQAVGANLAIAQREYARSAGIDPNSKYAGDAFRSSQTRKDVLARSAVEDSPELRAAQGQATRRLKQLEDEVGEAAAAQKLINETIQGREKLEQGIFGDTVLVDQYTSEVARNEAEIAAATEAQAAAARQQVVAEQQQTKEANEQAALEKQISQANRKALATQLAKIQRFGGDPTGVTNYQDARAQATRLAELHRLEEQQTKAQIAADFNADQRNVASKARIAAQNNRSAEQTKLATARNEAQDQTLLRAKADRIIQEKRNAQALQREVVQRARSQGIGRFQAYQLGQQAAGGAGGAGSFLGGGALSTLRYALPSALLFGGASFLSTGVREAEELQRQFVTLEAQLEAIGRSDQFGGLRENILGLARETGIAADELAQYAVQLQGAFGDIGADEAFEGSGGEQVYGQALVDSQLESAAKLSRIAGLTEENVVNDLTAASFAFESTGAKIGDVAVKIRDDFGVEVKETLDFLGQVGPVAQEAGFGLEEFAVIAAITQQRSGRGGSALAEAYGRVIPQIAQAREELLQLAAQESALNTNEFLGAVAGNDTASTFRQLAENFESLSADGQNFVVNLLGGRREAQAIIPALAQADKIARGTKSVQEGSAGLLDQRFGALAETLGVKLERLGEKVEQIFLALLEGGLGDILDQVIAGADLFAEALTLVAQVLNTINDLFGGLPIKIAAATAAVALFSKGISAAAGAAGVSSLAGPVGAGSILLNGFAGLRGAAAAGAKAGLGTTAAGLPIRGSAAQAFANRPLTAAGGAARGIASQITPAAGAAIGVGATVALWQTWQDNQASYDAASASLSQQVQAQNLGVEQIQKIRDENTRDGAQSVQADLYANVLGRKTLDQQLEDEEQKLQVGDRVKAFEAAIGAVRNLNEDERKEISNFLREYGGFNIDTNKIAQAEFGVQSFRELDGDQQQQVLRQALNEAKDKLEGNATNDNFNDAFDKLGTFDSEFGQVLSERFSSLFAENQVAQSVARNIAERQEKVAAEAEELSVSYDQTKALFEAGFLGAGAFAELIEKRIALYEEALSLDPGNTELVKLIQQESALQNQILSAAAAAEADFDNQLLGAVGGTGSDSGDTRAKADRLIEALPDIDDPDTAAKTIFSIIDLRKQARQQAIDEADTVEEAIAIAAQPIEFSPEEREALIEAQLQALNSEWQNFFDDFAQANYGLALSMKENLAQAILGSEDALEVVREALEAERLELIKELGKGPLTEAQRERLAQIQDFLNTDDLADALKEEFGVTDYGAISGDNEAFRREQEAIEKKREQEQKKRRQDAKNLALARLSVAQARAEGDPVATAQLGIQAANIELQYAETQEERLKAQAQYISASNSLNEAYRSVFEQQIRVSLSSTRDPVAQAQGAIAIARNQMQTARNLFEYNEGLIAYNEANLELQDAYNDVFDAQLELRAAQVSGDPVKAAQIGIQAANTALARAQGEAERARAAAQKIEAERSLNDAIKEVWNAQNDLLLAQANFVGDSVEAAQIGLRTAQANLQYIREQYAQGAAGQADVIRAEAELVNAQGAVRDAQLQDQLGDFEYLYEMEKITKSQLIQYLQSLKQIPDLTEDQIRDIDRRIKQLNDELGADLQFNLPTSLNLPTLYEARRLNQSAPGGYQDNRTNTFNIVVNNATDTEQVVEMITDATSGSRFGNQVRRY